MYSFLNLEPVYCSMSGSNCCLQLVLLVSLDLHTGFSGDRQSGLAFPSLEEFSTVCCDPHSERLSIVSEAQVDVFLELPCFFYNPVEIGNLISGSSAFSKSSLNI